MTNILSAIYNLIGYVLDKSTKDWSHPPPKRLLEAFRILNRELGKYLDGRD